MNWFGFGKKKSKPEAEKDVALKAPAEAPVDAPAAPVDDTPAPVAGPVPGDAITPVPDPAMQPPTRVRSRSFLYSEMRFAHFTRFL